MSVQRIGIVGCEKSQSRVLQHNLIRHGYLVDVMDGAADIVAYCRGVRPLVVVLDVGCDRRFVLTIIEALGNDAQRPFVVVAGPTSDPNCQIDCLAMGADDFIAQPIVPDELLARLGILLGRDLPALSPEASTPVDRLHQALTATEKGIFATLREAMPETLSREDIAWATRRRHIMPDDRSLDVHISHIRKKLGLIDAGFAIETVRGAGFRLVDKAGGKTGYASASNTRNLRRSA